MLALNEALGNFELALLLSSQLVSPTVFEALRSCMDPWHPWMLMVMSQGAEISVLKAASTLDDLGSGLRGKKLLEWKVGQMSWF